MRVPVIALLFAACGTDEPPSKLYGGDRPAELKTPMELTEGKQYPLLVVLHGFGASGFIQSAYFGVNTLVTDDKALLIAPDGIENSGGMQFWNADSACCDFGNQNPDDVGYIGGLIEDIIADWPVDKNQVFVLGHSNGGYMAYRMACERADLIAAIAPLAGNASSAPASCTPSRPVNVAHMHGTMDDRVPYAGAAPSVDQWSMKNGCGTTRSTGPTLDLDNSVDGAETKTSTTAGCPANGAVELWTMEGSGHIPAVPTTFPTTIFDWFAAHKRT
jgi:polyhydroxybutyrate depolymerase